MIIKSMTRKTASFSQLIDYINDSGKSDVKYNFYHNLYSKKDKDIKDEFERNASFLAARKNGVYMYHEVISITRTSHLSDSELKQRLMEITARYIQARAKNNLVYGVLHEDSKSNIHYHLIISANGLEDTKRLRLSKAEFSKIKKELENYVLDKHQELEQGQVINKQAGEKLSNRGGELKRRTGETPQKNTVQEKLRYVFASSRNKKEFFERLAQVKLRIYYRGNSIGIVDELTARKHRLKTLGLEEEFNKMSSILEREHKQIQKSEEKEPLTKTVGNAVSQEAEKLKDFVKDLNPLRGEKTEETDKQEAEKQSIIEQRKAEIRAVRENKDSHYEDNNILKR